MNYISTINLVYHRYNVFDGAQAYYNYNNRYNLDNQSKESHQNLIFIVALFLIVSNQKTT